MSIIAGSVITTGCVKVSHALGRKKAINALRDIQLHNAEEEYFDGILLCQDITVLMAEYEEDVRQINAIYDELLATI